MIEAVFLFVALIFILKIAWNLCVPYVLAARYRRMPGAARAGISIMPMVDLVALGAGATISFFGSWAWPWNPAGVLLLGVGCVVASYVHFLVSSALLGWLSR